MPIDLLSSPQSGGSSPSGPRDLLAEPGNPTQPRDLLADAAPAPAPKMRNSDAGIAGDLGDWTNQVKSGFVEPATATISTGGGVSPATAEAMKANDARFKEQERQQKIRASEDALRNVGQPIDPESAVNLRKFRQEMEGQQYVAPTEADPVLGLGGDPAVTPYAELDDVTALEQMRKAQRRGDFKTTQDLKIDAQDAALQVARQQAAAKYASELLQEYHGPNAYDPVYGTPMFDETPESVTPERAYELFTGIPDDSPVKQRIDAEARQASQIEARPGETLPRDLGTMADILAGPIRAVGSRIQEGQRSVATLVAPEGGEVDAVEGINQNWAQFNEAFRRSDDLSTVVGYAVSVAEMLPELAAQIVLTTTMGPTGFVLGAVAPTMAGSYDKTWRMVVANGGTPQEATRYGFATAIADGAMVALTSRAEFNFLAKNAMAMRVAKRHIATQALAKASAGGLAEGTEEFTQTLLQEVSEAVVRAMNDIEQKPFEEAFANALEAGLVGMGAGVPLGFAIPPAAMQIQEKVAAVQQQAEKARREGNPIAAQTLERDAQRLEAEAEQIVQQEIDNLTAQQVAQFQQKRDEIGQVIDAVEQAEAESQRVADESMAMQDQALKREAKQTKLLEDTRKREVDERQRAEKARIDEAKLEQLRQKAEAEEAKARGEEPTPPPAAVEPLSEAPAVLQNEEAVSGLEGEVAIDPTKLSRDEVDSILRGDDMAARRPVIMALFPEWVNRDAPDRDAGDFAESLWGEINEPSRWGVGRVPFPYVASAYKAMMSKAKQPSPSKGEVVSTPPESGVAKQPWEMTRAEYVKQNLSGIGAQRKGNVVLLKAMHRQKTTDAITEGKAVPDSVLADYPDLKAKPKEPQGESEPARTVSSQPVSGQGTDESVSARDQGLSQEGDRGLPEKGGEGATPETVARVKKLLGRVRSVYDLTGDKNASVRSAILQLITGKKVPKAKAGVNEVADALFKFAGIAEESRAGMATKLSEWAKSEGAESKPPSLTPAITSQSQGLVSDPLPSKAGEVYRIIVNKKQMYAIRGENPRGSGDLLFGSQAEADAEAARQAEEAPKQAAAAKAREEREAAQRESEAKAKAEYDDIDGFADDLPEIQRKRIISILNRNVGYKGKPATRKARIKAMIANGGEVRNEGGEDRLYMKDGRVPKASGGFQENVEYFTELTKTEIDYAKHLIAQKASPSKPTPPKESLKEEGKVSGLETAEQKWKREKTAELAKARNNFDEASYGTKEYDRLLKRRDRIAAELRDGYKPVTPKDTGPSPSADLDGVTFETIKGYKESKGVGKRHGITYRTATYESANRETGQQHRYEVQVSSDGDKKITDLGITDKQKAENSRSAYEANPEWAKAEVNRLWPSLSDYNKNTIAQMMQGKGPNDINVRALFGGAARQAFTQEFPSAQTVDDVRRLLVERGESLKAKQPQEEGKVSGLEGKTKAKPEPKGKEPWEMTRGLISRTYRPNIPNAPIGSVANLNGQKATKTSDSGKLGWTFESAAGPIMRVTDPDTAMYLDHEVAVRTAVAEGKPVPAEVLADYPELQAKAKREGQASSVSNQEGVSGEVSPSGETKPVVSKQELSAGDVVSVKGFGQGKVTKVGDKISVTMDDGRKRVVDKAVVTKVEAGFLAKMARSVDEKIKAREEQIAKDIQEGRAMSGPMIDPQLMGLYAAKMAIRVGQAIQKGGAAAKAKAKAYYTDAMNALRANGIDTSKMETKFEAVYKRAREIRKIITAEDGTVDIAALREAIKDKDSLRKALRQGIREGREEARKEASAKIAKIKKSMKDKANLEQVHRKTAAGLIRSMFKSSEMRSGWLSRIASMKTSDQMTKLLEEVSAYKDQRQFAKARKEVAALMKGFVRGNQKLRPEFKKQLELILGGLEPAKMSRRTKLKLQGTKDYLASLTEEQKAAMPDGLLDNLMALTARLDRKPIGDLTLDELVELKESIYRIAAMNTLKNTLIRKGRARQLKQAVERTVSDVVAEKPDPIKDLESSKKEGQADRTLLGKIKDFFSRLSGEIDSVDTIAVRIAGENTLFHKIVYKDLVDSSSDFFRINRQGRNVVEQVYADHKMSMMDVMEWMNGTNEYKLESGETLTLTNAEKLSLFLNIRNQETRDLIIENGLAKMTNRGRSDLKQMVTENDLLAITPQKGFEADLVDAIAGHLNGQLKGELNKTSLDLHFYEKFDVENYFPRIRDMGKKVGDDAALYHVANSDAWLEDRGFAKERSGGKGAVVIDNVLNTYFHHVEDSARYVAFAMPVRNARLVLSNDQVINAIDARYGKGFTNKHFMSLLVDLSGNPLDRSTSWESKARTVTRNIGVATLGFRVSTIINNWLGAPLGMMAEMDSDLIAEYTAQMANPKNFSNEYFDEHLSESEFFHERYRGDPFRMLSYGDPNLHGDLPKSKAAYQWHKMQQLSMTPMQVAERAAVVAAYKVMLKKRMAGGKTEAEVRPKLLKDLEFMVRRSQNPIDEIDMGFFGRRVRRSAAMRMMFMFTSQVSKLRDQLRRIWASDKYSKVEKTARSLPLFASLAVVPTIASELSKWIARGFQEEEEKDKKTLAEYIYGMAENTSDVIHPSVGQLSRLARGWFIKGSPAGAQRSPVTRTIITGARGVGDMFWGIYEMASGEWEYKANERRPFEKFLDGVRNTLVSVLGLSFGLPADAPASYGEGLGALLSKEKPEFEMDQALTVLRKQARDKTIEPKFKRLLSTLEKYNTQINQAKKRAYETGNDDREDAIIARIAAAADRTIRAYKFER